MAKIYGINGKITGKVGNTVFAVDGGIQVARQYNPIVANPRTAAQQVQRLKVNMAGQMSRGIQAAALEGLRGNRRQRRSALLSNLIKDVIRTEGDGSGDRMSFMASKLVLSTGTKEMDYQVSFVMGASVVVGKNQVQVTINPLAEGGSLPSRERVRLVVVGAPYEPGSLYGGVVSAVVDVDLKGEQSKSVNIDIDGSKADEPYSYALYAIPLGIANDAILPAEYVQGLLGPGYFVLPLSMETNGAYEYGRTYFVGMKKTA